MNASRGVRQFRHLSGRSLSMRSIRLISSSRMASNALPLGRILRTTPLRYFFASLLRVLRLFWHLGSGAGPPSTAPCDDILTAVVLLVERFHAHHRDAVAPAAPDDHLGRPALPELRLEELPHLVRELPPLCGLRGDTVLGHALGLLVLVAFLALVPIQLARDGRNRAADPGGCLLLFCLHKKVYRQRLTYSTSR